MNYLNQVWLTPYKEMFVSVWIDKFFNFGNTTTNRVESQHAKLKKYLESSQADLWTAVTYIHQVIESQYTLIKASIEKSRIVILHTCNIPHFQLLVGRVSHHALAIMLKEYRRVKEVGLYPDKCGHQLIRSHGLPCAHAQAIYVNAGEPIPLESIDKFWRTLDLSPCKYIKDEDFGCEAEVDMFKSHYQKQSNAGKRSVLKKLKDIFTPWSNSVREPPITRKNMRDRPSFRKPDVDPTSHTQEPRRYSCSNAPTFDQDGFHYQNDFSHQYVYQFPSFFHPYITHIQDVISDGNCGFRSIAICRGLHENEWPTVRRNLMEELSMYSAEYIYMFNRDGYDQVNNILNFFELHRDAPVKNWMTMPEIGTLIASKYNVILHVLNMAGSVTYFPIRSTPPPWYQHEAITIGYVNNNHYVKLTLTEGYPMPDINPQWVHFKYDCAAAWATPYSERINTYNQCMHAMFNRNN